jgi:hypothetical protein
MSINAQVRAMADAIKPKLTVAGSNIERPDDLYAQTLPGDDLTMETVEKVQRHRQDFLAATELAAGELVIEAMKADKELEQSSMTLKVGSDKVSVTVHRTFETKAPGSDTSITNYGWVTSSYKAKASAQAAHVRTALKAAGAAAFTS